jgi:hypothetical protein
VALFARPAMPAAIWLQKWWLTPTHGAASWITLIRLALVVGIYMPGFFGVLGGSCERVR